MNGAKETKLVMIMDGRLARVKDYGTYLEGYVWSKSGSFPGVQWNPDGSCLNYKNAELDIRVFNPITNGAEFETLKGLRLHCVGHVLESIREGRYCHKLIDPMTGYVHMYDDAGRHFKDKFGDLDIIIFRDEEQKPENLQHVTKNGFNANVIGKKHINEIVMYGTVDIDDHEVPMCWYESGSVVGQMNSSYVLKKAESETPVRIDSLGSYLTMGGGYVKVFKSYHEGNELRFLAHRRSDRSDVIVYRENGMPLTTSVPGLAIKRKKESYDLRG